VSRSGLNLGYRPLLFVLLGMLSALVAPCSARAMGCHAPERPTLGHTFSWERLATSDPIQLPSYSRAFAPVPCSGEVPGGVVHSMVPLSAATSTPVVLERAPEGRLVREEPVPSASIPFVSRLYRPPRPSHSAA
jgi:hypothetical protein